MADHELTPEEGLRRLAELFGSGGPSAPPTRTCRKHLLEFDNGEPVFRLAEMPSKSELPRSEIEVALDEIINEIFGPDSDGDEIVPQKLAKLFSGSLKMPRS